MATDRRLRSWLGVAGDAATIAAAVAVVFLVVDRYRTPDGPADTLAAMSAALVNAELGETLDVDFRAAERTAVVVVREDCPACNESLPFYRRLTARDEDYVQIVFAGPETRDQLVEYLASHGVSPDFVVSTGFDARSPFSATPTLAVADEAGVITHAWVGLLSTRAEDEVLSVLFGS